MSYSSLHTHSHFSLDGVGTVSQWVKAAKRKGLYGLAITDHGSCASLLEIKTLGEKENINTLMGCEFYLVKELGEKTNYHLTVLAKNFKGYQNLCKLISISTHKDENTGPHNHFYKKNRVTFNEFFEHKEGLIVCSGCLAGPVNREFLKGNEGLAEDYLREFHKQLGDDYFVEVQPSIVLEEDQCKQTKANQKLLELAKKYDIPLVITPDAHMIDEKDAILQQIKINTRAGKAGWEFPEIYHLYTDEELKQKVKQSHPYLEKYLDECIKNTNIIMDRGQFKLPEFPLQLPNVNIELHSLYETEDTQKDLIVKILVNNGRIDFNNKIYTDRLKYEIEVLADNGKVNLLPYFLVLEDIVSWSKGKNVVIGPGRGSAAGSLLCYGLGLTHLDPIVYGLPFERFINLGRIIKGTYPDVDMDFSDASIVKQYVKERYGEDKVASIGVYQALKTKSAIKDVLEVLRPEMSFIQKNDITSILPTSPQEKDELTFFHENLEEYPALKEFMANNSDIYDCVVSLLGQARQRGAHPCGVCIASRPLTETIPLFYDSGEWVTQYSAEWCEKAGVIKFDFLSLNTLKDISNTIKLIKESHNIDLDPYNLDWNDKKTFEAFSCGDTETVFQFHTPIAQGILKKMKADSLFDLSAVTSLGRPGPMDVGMHEVYMKRKLKQEPVEYLHSSLAEALKNTYGVMVYQESVMEAVKTLGGFSLEEADDIRRAMGKKKPELLKGYHDRFLEYCTANYKDIDQDRAEYIWGQIQSFSRYGFNLSHAMAYGMIGYICQYLRQHYPTEWYCSVFSNGSKDDRKNMYHLIKDIIVLPDINLSTNRFYIQDGKIISSLDFIEKVGETTVAELTAKQPFMNFDDLFNRVNKRIIRKDIFLALIFSGSLNSLHPDWSKNDFIEKFFGMRKESVPKEYRNLNEIDLLRKKYEYLPMGDLKYEDVFKDKIKGKTVSYDYINKKSAKDKEISIVGKVEKIIPKVTKNGDGYANLELANDGLKMRVIIWPEAWNELQEHIEKSNVLQIWGKTNIWNNNISVVLEKIKILQE